MESRQMTHRTLVWVAAPETCWACSCSLPWSSRLGARSFASDSAGGRHGSAEDAQPTPSWSSSRAPIGPTRTVWVPLHQGSMATPSLERQPFGQSSSSGCAASPAPCSRWRSCHRVPAPLARSTSARRYLSRSRIVQPQLPHRTRRRCARSATSPCQIQCSCLALTGASAAYVRNRSFGGQTGTATRAAPRSRRWCSSRMRRG
mmetsp:Transcript_26342/g.61445  ORF Transcript_26342/g.61445 Transcript_26342/m.61445 type:complete len:203 (-) Transcript_26342:142-750(-)